MSAIVVVAAASSDLAPEDVSVLARRLSLPLVSSEHPSTSPESFVLFYDRGRLSLRHEVKGASGSVCVDFETSSLIYRQTHQTQPEALLKAAGVKKGITLNVLDATAGLGQDAFILACAGCHVTMVERSKVLHAMLVDGLRRAQGSDEPRLTSIIHNLRLHNADSGDFLPQEPIDVVYLDPMFPERKKSAKVKKNMYLLQQLLHSETATDALLERALKIAGKRVVVKRPRHAGYLEGLKPSFQMLGKSSRFDIYLTPVPAT